MDSSILCILACVSAGGFVWTPLRLFVCFSGFHARSATVSARKGLLSHQTCFADKKCSRKIRGAFRRLDDIIETDERRGIANAFISECKMTLRVVLSNTMDYRRTSVAV